MDTSRIAIKEVGKDYNEKIATKQNKEDVVGNHPPFRREACKSSNKERDGDLYESDGEEEKDFSHGDQL